MRILSTCFHRPAHILLSADLHRRLLPLNAPDQSGVLLTPLTPLLCPFGTIGMSTIAVAISAPSLLV